jgi:hypothetical protein
MNLSKLFNENYKEYEKNEVNKNNYNTEELTQGLKFLNRRKKFVKRLNNNVKENMANMNLEGFTNNNENDIIRNNEVWNNSYEGTTTLSEQIKLELNQIENLQDNYNNILSNYKINYTKYITELMKYYSDKSNEIQYFGKLVKDANTNSKYYITLNGYRRWFSDSAYENCDKTVTLLKNSLETLKKPINEYKFIIGKHMKEGEPCGYEGMNIKVDRSNGNSILISRTNKGSTAVQSSTYNNNKAINCIDGNLNTFNHTNKGKGENIEINFGKEKLITRINITNRVDCCKNILTDFFVNLYDRNKNQVYSKRIQYPDGSEIDTFNINELEIEAQYIKIIQNKDNYLHLSLIDVYGKELLQGDNIIGKIGYVQGDGTIRLYENINDYNNRNKDCGGNIVYVSYELWNKFILGDPMKKTTICNILSVNPELKSKIVQLNTDLINLASTINNSIQDIKDKILLVNNKSGIEEKYKSIQLQEYNDIYNKLSKITNNSSTLTAMVEDSKIKNGIQNYRFLLWLLGAILLGIYTIKKIKQ